MKNEDLRKELYALAWDVANEFRDVLNLEQIRDYVCALFVYKYLSDAAEDGGERVIVLPQGLRFVDVYHKRNEARLGEYINVVLKQIEELIPRDFKGIFQNVNFNSEEIRKQGEGQTKLQFLIERFATLDLTPSRVGHEAIGDGFRYLLELFNRNMSKRGGDEFTPVSIAKLMAKIAKPQKDESICDPVCGTGTLLACLLEEVEDGTVQVYGQEVNPSLWAIAKMNLLLHGVDSARIELGDMLRQPAFVDGDNLMKFDVVVGDPPFGLASWGGENAKEDPYRRFWRGVPPRMRGDYAFLTHMIETAKPKKGRVVVVVPHGVLFREGVEGQIRKKLIEENLLDAVIGLPPKLYTITAIPVALLVFDRTREVGGPNSRRNDILFIDASREFTAGRGQNHLEDEHITKIVATYRERKEIAQFSRRVTIEEIRNHDYNLSISRYVDIFEENAEESDFSSLLSEMKEIEKQWELIRKEMNDFMQKLD